MTESDRIKAFFTPERRKLIRVSIVERKAQLPLNTLQNLLSIGRPLTARSVSQLIPVLALIGYVPSTPTML